jgi:hypothetical protein
MSEVKTNAVERHPIKKFLVELFSARGRFVYQTKSPRTQNKGMRLWPSKS